VAIALWKFPLRFVIPGILLLVGSCAFVASGIAGLSVIVRYLMVPSVMLCLFAAVAVGGWTMLRRGSRMRKAWALAAAVGVVVGVAYTSVNPPSVKRFDSELTFRGDVGRSLRSLLTTQAVSNGLRCGGVSVPTHKLIPDTRWILDLGESDVVARSDPSESSKRKARYGVAVFPVGRRNILRTGFAVRTDTTTQVPGRGFRRIAVDRYFAAYVRCPPGIA
jgi:hypothetical protein